MPPKLYVHEWLAVVAFVAALFFFSYQVFLNREPAELPQFGTPHYVSQTTLEVTVEGEVGRPGVHRVQKGSLVLEAIQKAEPLAEADLSKFKPTTKVRKNQRYLVPSKISLKVTIRDIGTFKVPKGTRVAELPKLLNLPESALFKSRRRLKDGEVLNLPPQGQEN